MILPMLKTRASLLSNLSLMSSKMVCQSRLRPKICKTMKELSRLKIMLIKRQILQTRTKKSLMLRQLPRQSKLL